MLLAIKIEAPMASFGYGEFHSYRPSYNRPYRSHIVGMLSACAGIPRDDEEGFQNISPKKIQVITLQRPFPGRDYQTIKSLMTVEGKLKETELRERHYVVGGSWLILIEDEEDKLHSLRDVIDFPVYAPYAGRKQFPIFLLAAVVKEDQIFGSEGPTYIMHSEDGDSIVGQPLNFEDKLYGPSNGWVISQVCLAEGALNVFNKT